MGMILIGTKVPAAGPKMTLLDCFQSALKKSETIPISDAEITAARGRYAQALGSILPQLSINASEFLQDTSGNSSADSTIGSTFTRFSRPEVAITLNQPIFQGVRAVSALKMASADRARQNFLRKDAERLLFQDVSAAFYVLAKIERDIATTNRILQAERSRLSEVRKRVDLGKSRTSELLAQETDLSLLEGELEIKKGKKRIAYEMMSFLTGLDPQPPIEIKNYPTGNLKSLDDYVSAVSKRDDILAIQKNADIARGNVGLKKSDLYPQIDAEANYYPYRVGFQKEIKWDALFTLNLPIFNWETYGALREAKAEAKEAELEAGRAGRQAVSDVKKAYAAYQSSKNRFVQFSLAAKKARESYLAQLDDFRLGLVNNLDVIQSQKIWLTALREHDSAEIQSRIDWTTLQITAGVAP